MDWKEIYIRTPLPPQVVVNTANKMLQKRLNGLCYAEVARSVRGPWGDWTLQIKCEDPDLLPQAADAIMEMPLKTKLSFSEYYVTLFITTGRSWIPAYRRAVQGNLAAEFIGDYLDKILKHTGRTLKLGSLNLLSDLPDLTRKGGYEKAKEILEDVAIQEGLDPDELRREVCQRYEREIGRFPKSFAAFFCGGSG